MNTLNTLSFGAAAFEPRDLLHHSSMLKRQGQVVIKQRLGWSFKHRIILKVSRHRIFTLPFLLFCVLSHKI